MILVLAHVAFTLSAQDSQIKTESPKKIVDCTDNAQTSITPQQAWALGCSAILTERNHNRHDLLGMKFRTPKNIEDCNRFLIVSGWDIKNRDDLLDSLIWIENGGHRQSFQQWGEKLLPLTDEEYQNLLTEHQSDVELLNEIKITKKYFISLGDKSLFGWDYSRYISLCRWGYLAGYLSEEEAWQKIMPVARLLQDKFDSWQDLGENYLIGRRFWSYEDSKLLSYQYEDAFLRLIDMPSSPWNKLPWNMDLTEKHVALKSN
jgi:hypothetical protein